ncbi:MAG: hypothetical protein P8K78_02230 [Pirellulales bacterium]|nr:hypothetical protein [Pirellulales bacterium]
MSLSCNKTDRSAELAPPLGVMHFAPLRLASFFVLFVASLAADTRASNTVIDSLEGPETSWELRDSDTEVEIQRHARVRHPVHSGSWSEEFRLFCAGGSFAYAETKIDPAAVIDELTYSVWIRGNRPGFQLSARVVLPRSIDPESGNALTLKIYGDSYQDVGRWQQVFIHHVMKQVRRQARILQSGQLAKIDTREAYIDRIMINLHGGSGETNVWIDDLTTEGFIGSQSASRALALQTRQDDRQSPRLPLADGSTVGPRVAKIIEYQGEPLSLLKAIGFNAVFLKKRPTDQQRIEANKHQLWLLGSAVEGATRVSTAARSGVRYLWYKPHRFDGAVSRQPPKIDPLISQHPLSPVHHSNPRSIKIQTQSLSSAARPLALADVFGAVASARNDLSYAEIRSQVVQKLGQGNRHFLFCSRMPLNHSDAANERRCKAIELILLELHLLTPFLTEEFTTHTFSSHDSQNHSSMLSHEKFSLVIPTPSNIVGTWMVKPNEPVPRIVPGVSMTARAFAIDLLQLRPIQRKRVGGGVQLEPSHQDCDRIFLLTEDPQTTRRTAKSIAATGERAQSLFHWLVAAEVDVYHNTCRQIAQSQPKRANMLYASDLPPAGHADRKQIASHRDRHSQWASDLATHRRLRAQQWNLWQQISRRLGFPSRAIALTRFDDIPEALAWEQFVATATRGPNLLHGGLSSAAVAKATGWHGIPTSEEGATFEFTGEDAETDCVLRVKTPGQAERTLLLESPAVNIPAGEIYTVEAEILARSTAAERLEPLLIFDSSRGVDLARRVPKATDWQRICLYRRSPANGQITVSLAIRGDADVSIRNLAIHRLVGENAANTDRADSISANSQGRTAR